MLLTCKCNAVVRIPSLPKGRIRCGKCAHTFTPLELCKATPEEPPKYELDRQRDINQEDTDGCPECLGGLRSDGYCVKCGQFYDLEG